MRNREILTEIEAMVKVLLLASNEDCERFDNESNREARKLLLQIESAKEWKPDESDNVMLTSAKSLLESMRDSTFSRASRSSSVLKEANEFLDTYLNGKPKPRKQVMKSA